MRIPDKVFEAALYHPDVLADVRARANELAPRVRAVAFSANAPEFARALRVVTGVRPGGKARGGIRRPYARLEVLMSPPVLAEMRTSKLSPRKIMRRGGSRA